MTAHAPVRPEVSAVVLAYGPEPLLQRCVRALLSSSDVAVEVLLVDNGCTTEAVRCLRDLPGVVILEPGSNHGFAGGCNLAVRRASYDVVVLVNSDAVVEPLALGALVGALDEPGVGIASGSLRLMDRPDTMNSAGNPVHFLGLSWAGALGEPATSHAEPAPVASATGALLALRRDTWESLGGFFEPMFAYCEDLELSLRCWQQGLSVRFVPDAVALHAYEFRRNPRKTYLLERNRLLVLLTLYERGTLVRVAVPAVALELAVLVVALRQGWAGQKVRGWWWLLTHVRLLHTRRAEVQASRVVPDSAFVHLLTGDFTPGAQTGLAAPRPLSWVSSGFWRWARPRSAEVQDGGRRGYLP